MQSEHNLDKESGKGRNDMKNVNMNFRITKKMRDEFHKIAENHTQNPSALIRKWIEEYIKKR